MLHKGHEDMLTNPARVLHLSARSPPPGVTSASADAVPPYGGSEDMPPRKVDIHTLTYSRQQVTCIALETRSSSSAFQLRSPFFSACWRGSNNGAKPHFGACQRGSSGVVQSGPSSTRRASCQSTSSAHSSSSASVARVPA